FRSVLANHVRQVSASGVVLPRSSRANQCVGFISVAENAVLAPRQPPFWPIASVVMVCSEIDPTTVSPLTPTRCLSFGGQPAGGCDKHSNLPPLQRVLLRQLRRAARAGAEDRGEHSTSWARAAQFARTAAGRAIVSFSTSAHQSNNIAARGLVRGMLRCPLNAPHRTRRAGPPTAP